MPKLNFLPIFLAVKAEGRWLTVIFIGCVVCRKSFIPFHHYKYFLNVNIILIFKIYGISAQKNEII